jgi:sulfatase modifying factor 1
MKMFRKWGLPIIVLGMMGCSVTKNQISNGSKTYKYFDVEEKEGAVVKVVPISDVTTPLWAKAISRKKWNWAAKKSDPAIPYFEGPVPFTLPPAEGSGEPFYTHNHQPSIAWLDNGDLMAIWFSTNKESGTEMTVLASRLRAGAKSWDPSSEFFKGKNRNMTGSAIFNDGMGKLYHFNGMGAENAKGWDNLAVLLRTSSGNGISWTAPKAIAPEIKGRHQVIHGTIKTDDGIMIQACDATPRGSGGTALLMSKDGGATWEDPGKGKPVKPFVDGGMGDGTIAGIHGGVVALKNGGLLAFGRSDNINNHMPMSISNDLGKTWTYLASPFPPISSGQRLVLKRLNNGAILLVSFTHHPKGKGGGMNFSDENNKEFLGTGMYAALSYDEGKSWPVRKLLTPGKGEYDGGAWTGTFQTSDTKAEPMGYLAITQSPDDIIHLISSRLHYRFNVKWLETSPKAPVQ